MIGLSDPKLKYTLIDFHRYGGKIDDIKQEGNIVDPNFRLFIFVSVPKDTHLVDNAGEKMCGAHLASYLKLNMVDLFCDPSEYVREFLYKRYDINDRIFKEMVVPYFEGKISVKYKVRDEEWTRELEEEETAAAFLASTKMQSN